MPIQGGSMETIGRLFVEAFNRRDAPGLVALSDPAIEFCPTELVGSRRAYHGHDGLRQWVADLRESPIQHQVRVREVRTLDEKRFLLLSEVVLGDGELISPSAMLAHIDERGAIVKAHAYLTDEQMLAQLDAIPDELPAGDS
jgi:hypothetical protein